MNKRNYSIDLLIKCDPNAASIEVVDSKSGGSRARTEVVQKGKITLGPFAVGVVKFE